MLVKEKVLTDYLLEFHLRFKIYFIFLIFKVITNFHCLEAFCIQSDKKFSIFILMEDYLQN